MKKGKIRDKNSKKLHYVDEWGLDKKSTKIVKKEIGKWINEFMARADNAKYQVELCDFKNDELFFFTKCQDILKDNPESTGWEDDRTIKKRKSCIKHALFLKQLRGDNITVWSRVCSHCGNSNMIIEHCAEGSYYRYCPDCSRFIIDTYIPYLYDSFVNLHDEYVKPLIGESKNEKKKEHD